MIIEDVKRWATSAWHMLVPVADEEQEAAPVADAGGSD
jgi:hypothetical protein